MEPLRTFNEILEVLGFPEDYKPSEVWKGSEYSKKTLIYFYTLFCKNKEGNLSFIEALDVYSQSSGGGGVLYLLSGPERTSERIEKILGLEEEIKRPWLEWGLALPNKFKNVLEKTIHQHYQENSQNDLIKILIEKARFFFYEALVYTMNTKEREVWRGKKVPAGHSFFGKHFSEFEQDAEMDLANCLYLMFRGETYNYGNLILKERGRLKILRELQDKGYLTDKQSKIIDEIKID